MLGKQKKTKQRRLILQIGDKLKQYPKQKKACHALGKLLSASLDIFLGAKDDIPDKTKESNNGAENELSTNTLQDELARDVQLVLLHNMSHKFNMEAAFVFQVHREPLLNCLVNGSVELMHSTTLNEHDLQRIRKARNENNYLC